MPIAPACDGICRGIAPGGAGFSRQGPLPPSATPLRAGFPVPEHSTGSLLPVTAPASLMH